MLPLQARRGALTSPTDRTTYILLRKPAGGSWAVSALPGSQPITQVRSAESLPNPSIKASVEPTGNGKQKLNYKIMPTVRAQVVPNSAPSISTTCLPACRAARYAAIPAVPAPMTATSTLICFIDTLG